jgi:hypothetical protein
MVNLPQPGVLASAVCFEPRKKKVGRRSHERKNGETETQASRRGLQIGEYICRRR